jgi:hypothetical protein
MPPEFTFADTSPSAKEDSARADKSATSTGGERGSWRALVIAGCGYLLLAILVWWNVWTNHPTSTTVCGCGDPSMFTWFLEWPAYAIAHGLNPFYSTAMGYPHGVNLLANTSDVALGVTLAPITWAFGPIATLNVALTLAPALSGVSMFVLLRRWTSWVPAAFVGGLLYGFSPMVLSNFESAHLNVTFLVVPPLVVACLDELLVRQRRRPIATGVVLGVLVTLQFFLGTEYLAIMVFLGVVGIAVVTLYARVKSPHVFEERAPYVIKGFKAAAVTAVLLLAYPAWFALLGPASLPGPIWPLPLSQFASHLRPYLIPPPGSSGSSFGYGGLFLSDQYLGFGLLVVLAGGMVIWHRDRRLWLFGGLGVLVFVLALGAADPVFSALPLLENIIPSRFNMVLYFCAAAMLAIILDHVYRAVRARMREAGSRPGGNGRRSGEMGWAGAVVALLVAVLAIGPIAAYWRQGLPLATRPVALPTWFRELPSRTGAHQVLLVLPDAVSQESPMTWQALDAMGYSMVDEGGPGGATTRGKKQHQAENILAIVSSPTYENVGYSAKAKTITPQKIAQVRKAMTAWGVTTVVIPDELNLPSYDIVPSDPTAAALVTAAVGKQPIYQGGAWVWANVKRSGPAIPLSTQEFVACVGDSPSRNTGVSAATRCVVDLKPSPSAGVTAALRQ